MRGLWGRIKCLIGLHQWREYERKSWGETIRMRRCSRAGCRRRERFFAPDSITERGRWTKA